MKRNWERTGLAATGLFLTLLAAALSGRQPLPHRQNRPQRQAEARLSEAWRKSGAPGAHTVETVLPLPEIKPVPPASYWYDEEVQTGDTLETVLARMGVGQEGIRAFAADSPIDLKKLELRAGQIISAKVDGNQEVANIQFFSENNGGDRSLIAIERTAEGKWRLHESGADTVTMPSLRAAVVSSSMSGALARAGVPVEIRTALKEIFADKANLDALLEGSSIRVLYESLYFRGQEVATGNILAAEISTGGRTYYAYYFENGDSDSGGNYYDENGNPLKQGFGGLPIAYYTRISSPYGIRVHPITHTVRMHTGIDYAAPAGTRVLAPADGTVSFRGWKGGYGNAVMVMHDNGVETLYGHLSAFVEGVDVGTRVGAGSVIALVGSTGHSTGPHLHYEVRINGQHVNPATVALPTPQLSTRDLAALKIYRDKVADVMEAVEGLPVMVSQSD
jgi:hypothetical protein